MGLTLEEIRSKSTPPTSASLGVTSTIPKGLTLSQIKSKNAEPTPPKQRGFLEDLFKRPVERLILEPARRTGEALTSAATLPFLNPQQKQNLQTSVQSDASIDVPVLGKFNTRGVKSGIEGAKQIAGETLESGAYLAGGGPATQAVKSTLKGKVLKSAIQGAKAGSIGGTLFGAGQPLQEGKGIKEAVEGGVGGGAIGAAAGATLGGAAPAIPAAIKAITKGAQFAADRPKAVQQAITQDVDELFRSTRGIERQVQLANQKRVPLKEIISDPVVFNGIKVEKATINPDEAIKVIDNRLDAMMDAKGTLLPAISNVTLKTNRDVIRKEAIDSINGTMSPADEKDLVRAINRQVDSLPEEMTTEQLDQFRARFRKSARDAKGLQKRDSEYAALENALRNKVFEVTDNLPFDTTGEFAALNNEIRHMIEARGFLDKTLRGQKVKGGRLGTYVGRGVGAVVGSHAGPLGALAGSEIGATVSKILQNNQLGSSMKMKLVKGLTDDPAILKEVDGLLKNVQSYEPLKTPALGPGAIRLGPHIGESSVKSVPAEKGLPGREKGKFKRTYTSTPGYNPNLISNAKNFIGQTLKERQ